MSLRNVVIRTLLAVSALVAGTAPAAALQMVNSGAVLDVAVFAGGEKQLEFTATVAPDSNITCPLIGDVRVAGMAVPKAAAKLQKLYGREYYVRPQVLVNVKENGGRIFIAGEVNRPGMYPLEPGLTAWSACVLAGGFTDFASTGRVRVTRISKGKAYVVKVDVGKVSKGKAEDVPLHDGDRIEVPRRLF